MQHSARIARHMKRCPFCEILAGHGPASRVYEDDLVLGFLDINPITPGHALIIPKVHAPHLADLDEATGRRMFTVAQRTAAAIRASDLRCEGVNLWLADGEAAFQDVFHVHLHVIPRFRGDGFHIQIVERPQLSRGDLDAIAVQIKSAYDDRSADDLANLETHDADAGTRR